MTKRELETALNERIQKIDSALSTLPDDVAVDAAEAFLPWVIGMTCTRGDRLTYSEDLYRVEQTHTTQAGWEPPNVPALFTLIPKSGEIPVWKQPTGAQDAYMTGDKVHYPTMDDPVYESEIDNNVWVPGVYGWRLT